MTENIPTLDLTRGTMNRSVSGACVGFDSNDKLFIFYGDTYKEEALLRISKYFTPTLKGVLSRCIASDIYFM